MAKAVIFDIDGTITDTNPLFLEAIRQAYLEFTGNDKPQEFFIFTLGIPSPETVRKLDIPEEKAQAFVNRWQELIKAGMPKVRLFAGIREVLETLQEAGIPMAIVTAKVRSEMSYQFDRFGLNHLFQVILCAEDAPRPKPYPDPLLVACEKLRVTPKEALFVGDSVYDITAARLAGVPFALASWGALEKERVLSMHPDFVLLTPEDLLKILRKDLRRITRVSP
ncbi:MAG: HAD family hydrolase [Candidatus Caldatribacterium sp.]|uniref:HAD family hydrolase n=1 Tax=Candidatus Caldatribacterium sp. TaxID=2282143 RepID=UPI002990BF7D|nr:HAD family hydrolase [Candidatus Caldatribacterium sp.]MCX7729961.1 HAD family hydrolase [Candidatus Caldatribacterium sp.]MDW8081510.1 HAD family hydrolase [Candidatus Calescibacterium sp.]